MRVLKIKCYNMLSVPRRIAGHENARTDRDFKEEKISRGIEYFGYKIDWREEKNRPN